jgi:5-methylcytosine-specific restriction enzyme subunit McrC
MVIDTKWKRIGRNPEDAKRGVSEADVYQIMAYARLYRCRDVMLLYPHHAGLGVKPLDAGYRILAGDERLRVSSIDLANGTTKVMQRLADLLVLPR